MTLNGVMAVTLRYFTEFGKLSSNRVDLRMAEHACTSLLYFVVRVRCRRKKFTFAISSPDEFLVLHFANGSTSCSNVLCQQFC